MIDLIVLRICLAGVVLKSSKKEEIRPQSMEPEAMMFSKFPSSPFPFGGIFRFQPLVFGDVESARLRCLPADLPQKGLGIRFQMFPDILF